MIKEPTPTGTRHYTGDCHTCERRVHRPAPANRFFAGQKEIMVNCIDCGSTIPCNTQDTTEYRDE